MKTELHKIKKIFFSTFYLSACTFGGGYVIVSFMKRIFVDDLHWIENDEMLDLTAIAQSSPGAVAVNGAAAVGYKISGVPGVIAAALGSILPPFLILSVITGIYNMISDSLIVGTMLKGMQAGIAAIIASVTLDMTKSIMGKSSRMLSAGILAAAFMANYILHVSAVWIILFCGGLGAVRAAIPKADRKEKNR